MSYDELAFRVVVDSWASGELASGHDGKRRRWIQQSRGRRLVDVVSLVRVLLGASVDVVLAGEVAR